VDSAANTAIGSASGVRMGEVDGRQPRVQIHRAQLARPVVRAAATLHGHDAARRQFRAPGLTESTLACRWR
jgi:hypothetical protein